MSLPNAWVDRIHARLLVRYGAAWIRKWEGVPMEAVKADWGEVLAHVSPAAVAHALDHLPDDAPPNAVQFRALCAASPKQSQEFEGFMQRLGVKPDPERVKRELSKLKDWRAAMEQRMRETPPAATEEYRRTEGFSGPFTPPPEHTLPPGMRKDAS